MDITIGQKFSHIFKINESQINSFRLLSGDNNPLHINSKYAIEKGFDEKIVYGNLQNCFLSFFVGEMFPIKNVIIISQSINFNKPVYNKNIIRLKAEIINILESIDVYELKFEFLNKKQRVSFGKIFLKKI